MGVPDDQKILNNFGYESLVVGGSGQSVNFDVHVVIYHSLTTHRSASADVHMLTEAERTHAKEVFLEYGPTPRLCIDLVLTPPRLDEFRNERTRAIANLKLDTLITAAELGEDLDMRLSRSILLIKRKNVDDLHEFTIEPMSLSVKRLLQRQLKQLATKEKKERLQTYLRLAKSYDLMILAAIVFESLAQLQLQERVALNLVPMVKVPALQSRENAKWQSQSSIPADAANPPFWILFKPTDTVEYDESTLSGFQAGVFYVPTSSNESAFDSFILVDQVLYIFRFSIASLHEINEGIPKLLSRPTFEAKLEGVEWRFIFIIPSGSDGSTIVCSESNVADLKEFWDSARLFTAEIRVDFYQAEQPRGGDGDPNPNVPNHPNHPRPHETSSSSSQSGDNVPPLTKATSSKARKPGRRRRKVLKAGK
jgi:hypothetical protein